MDDEDYIYKCLEKYSVDPGFKDIRLNFNEGTLQQNGHKIYKVSGLYQGKVSFEIQIKSTVHNVWGEVEHKTIYKGRQYALDTSRQQTITEEIFNILKASDKQLLALFTHEYTEKDLVFGLFAEQTRQSVMNAANTEYLAIHYKGFFGIFSATSDAAIYKYVSSTLIGKAYERTPILLEEPTDKVKSLAGKIKDEFIDYYLRVQYHIAQELYTFESYDGFIDYLAEALIMKTGLDDEEDALPVQEDAFSYAEDAEESGNVEELVNAADSVLNEINMLVEHLANLLPGARKEGK